MSKINMGNRKESESNRRSRLMAGGGISHHDSNVVVLETLWSYSGGYVAIQGLIEECEDWVSMIISLKSMLAGVMAESISFRIEITMIRARNAL